MMEKEGKKWNLRLNEIEWADLHTIDHSLVCQNVGSLLCFPHLIQHFSPQEQSRNLPLKKC